jgi:ComF family protein
VNRTPPALLRRWAGRGLDLLYAPQCAWCSSPLDGAGSSVDRLCSTCQTRLVIARPATCGRCGAIVPTAHARQDDCARCRDRRYHFLRTLSLGVYEGELREAVLRMKRPGQEPLARALAELLWQVHTPAVETTESVAGIIGQVDVVAPVPMHWRRRLLRGVNSPDLIAEHWAARLGLPLATGLVRRLRNTPPQADIPTAQRFRNIRGAFRIRRRYQLRAARVLLVDDILTTGATCSEVAKVLCAAGAEQVTVLVLARAEG